MLGMSSAVFRNPPGRSVPVPGVHDAFARELRANPGQWAVWKTYTGEGAWNRAGPAAQSVRTGRVQSFRPGGTYEATARSEADGVVIYARYVGGPNVPEVQ
jgi:hypothetical protein